MTSKIDRLLWKALTADHDKEAVACLKLAQKQHKKDPSSSKPVELCISEQPIRSKMIDLEAYKEAVKQGNKNYKAALFYAHDCSVAELKVLKFKVLMSISIAVAILSIVLGVII